MLGKSWEEFGLPLKFIKNVFSVTVHVTLILYVYVILVSKGWEW